MISGFMIVKNVLEPGYPFVEAIASALPVCDEFLVADGYSTDGTYEVISKISELNKKVKIFRQEWPKTQQFTVLADATNWVRAKCVGDYIFSLQANEVVHEQAQRFIKALPEMCPQVETFSLPFFHLARTLKFSEQFRLRFSKNLPSIVASGDAWTLGVSKKFVRSEAARSARNPRKLMHYVGAGIQWTYANSCGNPLSRAIYLPRPVFRYWALFPRDYIEKCKKHEEMFNLSDFSERIKALEDRVDDDPVTFWKLAAKSFQNNVLYFQYPEGLGEVEIDEHPRIMGPLLSDSKAKKYYVREELFDKIKEL